MKERKLRFNFVDVLILLVIAAVIFVLLYVFVLKDKKQNIATNTEYATVRYVVQAVDIDENFDSYVSIGDSVEEAVERKQIGKVVGVQSEPYQKVTFDYDTGIETVATVEGKITINVTIEAVVTETETDFTIDGAKIKVGMPYSLALPNLYLTGYCISLDKIEN